MDESENKVEPLTEEDFYRLADDFLAGRIGVLEFTQATQNEDYWLSIMQQRVLVIALKADGGSKRFMREMEAEIEARASNQAATIASEKADKKDVNRLFPKLVSESNKLKNKTPSYIYGETFSESLTNYLRLIKHLESLRDSSYLLFKAKHFSLATFNAILLIEEVGKLRNIGDELMFYDMLEPVADKAKIERNHRVKHFIGVASGALINARLDRIVGIDAIANIVSQAETGELEIIRQKCLYADISDGKTVIPNELIDQDFAKNYVVLAGEVLAEVISKFPWEYERMMSAADAFEREIGINPDRDA